jgi:DNA-binding response OmpR family regulator
VQDSAKILVVDDLEINVEFLREELTVRGFTVFSASDGEQALQQVVEEQPDLLLLDLSMPRMDGISVLKALRADEEYRDLPVILLTARREPGNKVEGLDAGADDYITKPFQVDEVIARIRSLLRMRQIQADIVEKERRLARVETLRQTLATLSHHINNATQAILGAAQLCELTKVKPDRLIAISLHQTARIKAVLDCLDRMVQHMDLRTTEYAGEDNRILDIEEELKQRLLQLDPEEGWKGAAGGQGAS